MPRTERAIRDRCGATAALLLALCAGASPARAQAPAHRVADIQTAPASNLPWPDPTSSDPGGFAQLGGQALFWARTPQSWIELWSTDGSEAGTRFVKEVAFPGSIGPQMSFYPTNYPVPGLPPPMLGGALYFAAGGSSPYAFWGRSLWKSDGTPEGTVLVKDVPIASYDFPPVPVNGTLVFASSDPAGIALWTSDGTAEGTALLELLVPGGIYAPWPVALVDDLLYFHVYDHYGGGTRTLWRTDGTEAGTFPILSGETLSNYPEAYAGLDGTLYFRFEQALWKSDGTVGGTALVTSGIAPYNLASANGRLFFTSSTTGIGAEPWTSDGSSDGTVLVADVWPGSSSSQPEGYTELNGAVLFFARDDVAGEELWRTDGSAAGTQRVKDIRPGVASAVPGPITVVNGEAFFRAYDDANGYRLWKSDGTEAGTQLVEGACPCAAYPWGLANVNGMLLFAGHHEGLGVELWKSDGSASGTMLVKDIASIANGDSSPQHLVDLDGTLLFTAESAASGVELWRSDGTQAGTTLVKDLDPGPAGSTPKQLARFGSEVRFLAQGPTGWDLYASDGTEAGTVQVKDLPGFSAALALFAQAAVEGTFFFEHTTASTNGNELWKSDGTDAGTLLVKDIRAGTSGSSPEFLTDVAGTLLFAADDGVSGRELWRSDGTSEGTALVQDIAPGAAGSVRGWSAFQEYNFGTGSVTNPLMVSGGTLYFPASAAGSFTPNALWRSDGTAAGTSFVASAAFPYCEYLCPPWATDFFFASPGGTLFMTLADPSTLGDLELWKSDGTGAGTQRVADIHPGAGSSFPYGFTDVGGTLFFAANDPVGGIELWKSDGSEAGTERVANIAPGVLPSLPTELTEIDGRLVFSACDDAGCEVWTSDGTEAGTRRVADVEPGPVGSNPTSFTASGPWIYFSAQDALAGRELWAIPRSALQDSDGDGLDDATEAMLGTDPGDVDSDDDGLGDGAEVNLHGTDPLLPDSDGDGFSDGAEVNLHGTDPLDALSHPPTFVPSLSPWGAAALATLLAHAGWRRLRTRQPGGRRSEAPRQRG